MTKENKLKNESIDLVTEFIKTSIVYYCYDSLPYLNDDSAPAVLTIPSLQKTGDDEYLDCTEAETYAELILHNLESNINYLIFEEITHYFKDILDEEDEFTVLNDYMELLGYDTTPCGYDGEDIYVEFISEIDIIGITLDDLYEKHKHFCKDINGNFVPRWRLLYNIKIKNIAETFTNKQVRFILDNYIQTEDNYIQTEDRYMLNENSYLQKEDRCVEETRNLKLENYSYLYDMQGATEYTDSVIKYLLGGTGFRHSVNSIRFILLEIARDYGFEVNDIGIKLRRYSNRNVSRYTDIADEYRESNPEFGKPMSKKSFCKRFGLKKNIMFLKFNFGSDSL